MTGKPVPRRGVSLTVDKKRIIVSPEKIAETVQRLGQEINARYVKRSDRAPILTLGVMNGAFIFLADLVRQFKFETEIDFIRLSSYGTGTTSSGRVQVVTEPTRSLEGRDVLIVEDLIDSGRSLAFLVDYCRKRNAKTVAIVVLLNKPARRVVDVQCDFIGREVEDVFLAGYGLDNGVTGRQYPFIFDAK